MHNVYLVIFASIVVIQIYASSLSSYKVDSTIRLVNESMIVSCVTEQSKLVAYEKGIDALILDQDKVKDIVGKTINDNIGYLKPEIGYYFYDAKTLNACPVGVNKCNSVQIKIEFIDNSKTYERILRFEAKTV